MSTQQINSTLDEQRNSTYRWLYDEPDDAAFFQAHVSVALMRIYDALMTQLAVTNAGAATELETFHRQGNLKYPVVGRN
jgi:hypothetical protein